MVMGFDGCYKMTNKPSYKRGKYKPRTKPTIQPKGIVRKRDLKEGSLRWQAREQGITLGQLQYRLKKETK